MAAPIPSADLALTRYAGTASAAPLPAAESWGGLDLRVVPGARGDDLATVRERDNLGQALTLRLLTVQGALAPLGHPTYGSRLVSLIGRRNDESARHLARLYVIEAVKQEPRVAAITALAVTPVPGQPDTIRIELSVRAVSSAELLALSLDVDL